MADISKSIGSLVRSAILMMVGGVLGRAIGLVGEALIARLLQPELYGSVSLAYTIVSAVAGLSLLGINEGLTRLGSTNKESKAQGELIVASFITTAFSGIIGMVLLYLFRVPLAETVGDPMIARYLLLLSPIVFIGPLSKIVISILRIQKKSAATVLVRALLSRILPIVFVIIASMYIGDPILGISYWILAPSIILCIGGLIAFSNIDKSYLTLPTHERIRELWTFSWPIAVSSVIFLLLSRTDIIMIGYFLDSRNIAYYRVIQPLRQAATMFIGSFSFLFLPLATEAYNNDNFEEVDTLFGSVAKWGIILTIPIILTFVYRSTEVVILLFGQSYTEAAFPLAILSGGLFLRTISGPNGDVIKTINRTEVEIRASIGGLFINLFLNWILIPIYGISGAAIATVAGYTVYNGIELVVIYRETGVTPFSMAITKIVVSNVIVMGGFNAIIPKIGLISLVIFGIISCIVSISSVIVTQSVEDADTVLLDRVEDRFGRPLTKIRSVLKWGMK